MVPSFVRVPALKDEMMEGSPAIYLGRLVSKENFRAFIYAPNGGQRLVESWEEFEANMQSGVWFATPEDAQASIAVVEEEKPKAKPRPSRAKKVEEVAPADDEPHEEAPADDLAFEVTDDFLPKG